MSDKERIEAIMSHYHLNNVAFCNKVGLNQATLSNILRGSTNPSLQVMRNVLEAFPQISPVWMFCGDGEMLNSDTAPSDAASSSTENPEGDLFSQMNGFENETVFGPMPTANRNAPESRQPSGSNSRPATDPRVTAPAINVTDIVTGVVSQLQKPQRKITEVRIFFDDGTYETFSA